MVLLDFSVWKFITYPETMKEFVKIENTAKFRYRFKL